MAETPFSPDPQESGSSPTAPAPPEATPATPEATVTEPAATPSDSPAPEAPSPAVEASSPAPEAPSESPTPPMAETPPEKEPEAPQTAAPATPAPAEPVSVPEPPAPAGEQPGIAATLDVPAQEGSSGESAEGGGEFDLLLQKIREWFNSGELQAQWQRLRGPLRGLAILIGVVVLLRVYASLIGTIDSLPVVGGLLELVGLIALTRFSLTRLVRRSDREQVFADWRRRWNDFSGKE